MIFSQNKTFISDVKNDLKQHLIEEVYTLPSFFLASHEP